MTNSKIDSPRSGAELELLKLAGPRPQVNEQIRARVYSAVKGHWQKKQADRRRALVVKLAAAVIVAVGVASLWFATTNDKQAETAVAIVELIRGSVDLVQSGSRAELVSGASIGLSSQIETSDKSRIALRLVGGHSVRLDHSTRLSLESPQQLRLETGAIYVDSDHAADADKLTIITHAAEVQEFGTAYEVRLVDNNTRVRVREGAVEVRTATAKHQVEAGWGAVIDTIGAYSKHRIVATDPDWSWTLTVAPPFEIEGRTVAAFLDWFSRETGLAVAWFPLELEKTSGSIILHGDTVDVSPKQAPDLVLPTCGLEHRQKDGVLLVSATPR